jgi:hypothetical protein
MQKLVLAVLFSTMAIGAGASTPDGKSEATEARNLPPFSSITLNGVSTVRIHRGPQAIRITMEPNLLDRYETKVRGGRLVMGFKWGIANLWALRGLKRCEVDISVPELDHIEVNGAGTLIVDEFAYRKLGLEVNGSGSVELKGSASELRVSCTGACKISARNLAANAGWVSMTGSGRVELRVIESLDVSLTGSGELGYWGDPKVSQKLSGAGSLRRKGD